MKDQFLPHEHCRMLKELGFDEPCIAYFFDRGGFCSVGQDEEWFMTKQNSTLKKANIAMVLWQQIEEWLWDTHKISIECECVSVHDIMFKARVYHLVKGEPGLIQYLHFDSPITAKVEGIKKAVEYLHELVAQKIAARIEDTDNKK